MDNGRIAPQIGREQEIEALGRKWRVPRLSVAILDKLTAWVKTRLPDPFAGLHLLVDRIPADAGPDHPLLQMFEKKFQEAQARDAVLLSLNSPEFAKHLDTPEGGIRLLQEMLAVYQPDVTSDDVFQIAREFGPERLQELFRVAAGQVPGGNAGAPAAASKRRGRSTGKRRSSASSSTFGPGTSPN